MADEAQQQATPQDSPPTLSDLDAEILAELEGLDAGETSQPEPKSDDAAEPEDETETEGEEAENPAEGEPDADEEGGEGEKPEAEPEPEKEPDTDKRLEAIRQAEKRAKDAVARERQQLADEQAEWKERVQAAERFESLKSRAAYDPAGVLEQLGYKPEDFAIAARDIYLRSPEAKANPQMREQAAHQQKTRQTSGEVAELRAKVEAMEKAETERKQQEATEKRIGEYIDLAAKEIADSTPIVKNMMAKNPAKTRALLRAAAEELTGQLSEVPEPAEVAKHLEKLRRAELEEAGVDVAAMFATKKTKPESQPADEKKTAKTLSDDVRTTTKPPRSEPKTTEELDAEILRELQSGEFD